MLFDKRINALKCAYTCLNESNEEGFKQMRERHTKGGPERLARKKRETKELKKKQPKSRKRNDKWVCSEKFDCVRSRHSAREGGGSSARWRWRVVCLAPGCSRAGVSYDKSDRLMHHVSRNPVCKLFWEQNVGPLPWETSATSIPPPP